MREGVYKMTGAIYYPFEYPQDSKTWLQPMHVDFNTAPASSTFHSFPFDSIVKRPIHLFRPTNQINGESYQKLLKLEISQNYIAGSRSSPNLHKNNTRSRRRRGFISQSRKQCHRVHFNLQVLLI